MSGARGTGLAVLDNIVNGHVFLIEIGSSYSSSEYTEEDLLNAVKPYKKNNRLVLLHENGNLHVDALPFGNEFVTCSKCKRNC